MASMTLEQAQGYFDQADDLYSTLYSKRCALACEAVLPRAGTAPFKSLPEAAIAIMELRDQIKILRAEIEELATASEDRQAAKDIAAVCKQLGIPCQQG